MNKDDVIRMAREAGWALTGDLYDEQDLVAQIEYFAALVAAHVPETEFKPDWNNYQQGLKDGAAEEREAKEELLAALQDLLMDTQHAEHECQDKNCPVANAVHVALKYDKLKSY